MVAAEEEAKTKTTRVSEMILMTLRRGRRLKISENLATRTCRKLVLRHNLLPLLNILL